MRKKGLVLFESLIAALIITIIGSGVATLYLYEAGLLNRTAHRLQAINYAKAAAEAILAKESSIKGTGVLGRNTVFPTELSLGLHSESTDPAICTLPDSYFKQTLKGSLSYTVTQTMIPLSNFYALYTAGAPAYCSEITVEWTEAFPKGEKVQEKLFTVFFYQVK